MRLGFGCSFLGFELVALESGIGTGLWVGVKSVVAVVMRVEDDEDAG